MPQLAKKIVVDHNVKKMFVDGVEFLWEVAVDGPERVDVGFISTVMVPVLCESFESIGDVPVD